MTILVNIYKDKNYDVYIGRGGHGLDGYFGNPFDTGTREEKVQQYKGYFYKRLADDPEFKRRVEELKNKRIACFCWPKLCHGMVIIEYLEGVSIEDQIAATVEPTLFD
jgi:hypothetical protein